MPGPKDLSENKPITTPNDESDRVVVSARRKRFSINEFRSEIEQNGILQTNRFIVMISLPPGLKSLNREFGNAKNIDAATYNEMDNFLVLRCDSVVLPGVFFYTNDGIMRHGIGQMEKRPYLPTFNPVKLDFIVDKNARVVKFFNDWTNSIVPYNTDFGLSPNKTTEINKPYLLNYPDNYMSPTIRIWVYNQQNEQAFGAKLYTCFPLNTTDMDLSWGSDNTAMRFSVTMQYTHMSQQFVEVESNGSLKSNEEKGLLDNIFNQTGKVIQDTIYTGTERIIVKAFDRFFK